LGVLYLALRAFSSFLKRERVPHLRLRADYGVENVVIEAKSPLGRVKDRESAGKFSPLLPHPH
jgi:hypothetical protein